MTKDLLDETGLTLKSANTIREELVNGYKGIYGKDINLDSNTQDGQLIDLLTQINVDLREVIREVYNTGNPDTCRGTIQDVRYRINNLYRKGGTFTIVPITLKVSKTVELEGLDSEYNNVNATAYGFADNSGNNYYLLDSETFTPGEYVRSFRASKIGDIEPVVGTITNPIEIVVGVDSGINASAPITVGINQETDEDFCTRRERSTSDKSQNSIDGLRAQLLDLDGVSDAFVYNHDYENYPNGEDADGIPPHYIWAIVEGGANSDIATAIYANCGGAGTKGDVSVNIPTASGQTFTAHFDRVISTPLYIRFDLQEIVKDTYFDIEGIKDFIVDNLSYETNEVAETSKPTEVARTALSAFGGAGVPINLEISTDGINYVDYIPSASKQHKFTVDITRIEITEINL